ncbi:hypothetical protein GALL_536980 [mine drainage metagenome]|uniref:Uncharacterized protein n=1 Tax=mine drainage metagenome TaxID=410659 RepID=A0A1J5P0X6_9ZZZZ
MLKVTFLVAYGTGISALDVTEHLGLKQGFGDGPAIDRNKRLAQARVTQAVQGPRHHLFADTGLTGDQHRDIVRSQTRQHRLDVPHGLGNPQYRFACHILRTQQIFCQNLAHHLDQYTDVDRFGQIVFSTELEQAHRPVNQAIAGHKDVGWQLNASGAQLFKQTLAVNVGQLDVADHHAIAFLEQRSAGRLTGLEPAKIQPLDLETVRHRLPHDRVIFNQANACQAHVRPVFPKVN